MGRPINLQV